MEYFSFSKSGKAIPPFFRKSSAINSRFVASCRDIGANLLLPTYDFVRPIFLNIFQPLPEEGKSKLERDAKRRLEGRTGE